jgi:hypothetical protein
MFRIQRSDFIDIYLPVQNQTRWPSSDPVTAPTVPAPMVKIRYVIHCATCICLTPRQSPE